MSNILNPSTAAGSSQQKNTLSDAQFSSYVRKQSVSAQESLNAGLTIKTKEGDLVTLNSNTYAQLDAFQYNSRGVLETDTGTAMVSKNHREITLTTGESFSFSVVGDLSEDELSDIEVIIKGIDEIISEMAQGDMDEAIATALSMGGYDTVSMYSADITYEKSYEMMTQTSAQQIEPELKSGSKSEQPLPEPSNLSDMVPNNNGQRTTTIEPFPDNYRPPKNKGNSLRNIDRFVEKMAKELEKHKDELVDKAQKPIDNLFNHHKKKAERNHGKETFSYNAIENAQKKMEKMIDKMASKIFKNYFSEFSI